MRSLAVALAVIVALLGGAAITVAEAATVGDCSGPLGCADVESDGETKFTGTGAMVLPRGFQPGGATRQSAAACDGCAWEVATRCSHGFENTGCAGAAIGCPPGELMMRVRWRPSGAEPWSFAGQYCSGSGDPVAVADLAAAVRERFVAVLPRPEPSFQPAAGAVVNVPAVFSSGQRGGVRTEDRVLFGLPVEVEARPTWRWDFGDGTRQRTDAPGGRFPDVSVSHTYAQPGARTATCEVSWAGTFTVDGLGPFDVDGGPVTRSASIEVPVRESAARLTAGR